jgi:hypothetical protein
MPYSAATLNPYSESGAGIDSLWYFGQTVTTVSAALWIRTEYPPNTPWRRSGGMLLPQARLEFQHDFKAQSTAGIAYADLSSARPLSS